MTPVLVLLSFFSLAMLASRRDRVDEVLGRAATPLLVALGAAVAPDGLGFLTPSVVRSLVPAVQLGLFWLAAISGMRATAALSQETALVRAAVVASIAAAVASAAALAVLTIAAAWGKPVVAQHTIVPAAAVLGASIAIIPSRRGESGLATLAGVGELFALAGALGALAWWSGPMAAAITTGLGVLAAVLVRLLAGRLSTPPVVLIASATLTAGLASLAALPGAVAGQIAGAVGGRMRGGDPALRWLEATERPIRGLVTFLLAASAGIDATDLALGAALGGATLTALLSLQLVVQRFAVDDSPRLEQLADAVATSSTALVLLGSFAAAERGPGTDVLAPLLVALSAADACSFFISTAARASRRRTRA